jgi:hypothetical protein
MVDHKLNPVRKKPLYLQRNNFKMKNKLRSREYNLTNPKNKAQTYVFGYTKKTSNANKKVHVKYGNENKDEPVLEFWNPVYFTDQAHYNLDKGFQRYRVLDLKMHRSPKRRPVNCRCAYHSNGGVPVGTEKLAPACSTWRPPAENHTECPKPSSLSTLEVFPTQARHWYSFQPAA